jgi:TonB family protein
VTTGHRIVFGLAAVAAVASVQAADLPDNPFRAAPTSIVQLNSVAALDESQSQLTRSIWQVYQNKPAPPPDYRGRKLQDDVNQWLMTAPQLSRLAELRAQADAGGAVPQGEGARGALAEASALLEQERDRLYLVWAYWAQQDRIAAHAANFVALEARLPTSATTARRAPVEAALKDADSKYQAALAASSGAIAQQEAARLPMEDALQHVLDTYNIERGKLGVDLSTAERQAGHEALSRTREAPCPAPVSETSPNDKPALLPGTSSPDSFYPSQTRKMSFEGDMLLEAEVSASGCIEKVTVYESSGVYDLDQAALDWALIAARMRPAQRDHQPVAGALRFRMRFRLRG